MPVKKQQQIKKEKIPKMRKARVGRAGRAPRSAAGKAGQKQSQKLIVQLGEKNPFAFSQQQGLTLQDLINFEATRGQRLGTRQEEKQAPITGGSIVGPGPLFLEPEISRPNIAALGSVLMKEQPVIPEAGSLEAMKSQIRPKPVLSEVSKSFELNKSQMKPKPVLSNISETFEIMKENPYLNQLRSLKSEPVFTGESGSLEIMKSQMRPKPVFSEETGSLEIMKSQMKPKPVLTEQAASLEIMKSKPPRKKKEVNLELVEMKPAETQTSTFSGLPSELMPSIIQEVFNRPITTKSLFEQIAKTQPPPEAYSGLEPPSPEIEVIKRRSDYGQKRGSTKEKAFLEGLIAGTEAGLDIGIPVGRDVQNTEVMNVEQLQSRKIKPGQMTLVPTAEQQPASSSSDINFA